MTGQVEKIRDDLKAGFLVAVLMARACRSEAAYMAPEIEHEICTAWR